MKNLFLLLLVTLGVAFMSCEKISSFTQEGPQNPNQPKIKLYQSIKGAKEKGEITSNSTITVNDTTHYSSFWLEPSSGDYIAKGIFTIRKNGIIVYQSASPENGVDFRFTSSGVYTLEVNGDNFSFVNIIINVFVGAVNPPTGGGTSPIRLYDFDVSNAEATVKVAASISQWGNITSTQFFHLRRINSLNFITNQSVTFSNDSVFFKLAIPKVNSTFVEFNAGFQDGSTGGRWLTPSAGNPPSTLYNGIGVPYSDSQYFFGFKLVQTSTGWELQNSAGLVLLSTVSEQNTIPGNNGDGFLNNYQVRWSGLTYYFKTSLVSPDFQFKIGENGSAIHLTATICSENSNYKQVTFPVGTNGQIWFKWGNPIEQSNSMFWDPAEDWLIKNL